jgi:two-component system CheB/CheR fusion protein
MANVPDDDPTRLAAQAKLAAIVDSSDDAIVSKSLDGIITSWNPGAQRIFGYTAEEAVGRSINILIPPDRHGEEPMILAKLRAGQRVDHFETVRITKDGRLIDVSVTISPVRDERGKIIAASKIARDVTAQKQVQRELGAAKEQAESASRAKDQFLSVLSHELRTPLMPVLAAVSYIENNPHLPPDELRGHLEMIRRNVETEARLVDDLLDLTRIVRGKIQFDFEVVDAHAALRGAVSMVQREIVEKGLAMTVALRAKDHHVWADPGRLQQVFLNLLSNAVKFTPPGGGLALRSSDRDGGGLVVEVTDTGIGIEADALPRLFQPFEQGDRDVARRFGGLGLGLSIARSIVETHKGRISAASVGRDAGATFTVELPTVPPASAPGAMPARPSAAAPSPKNCRILLVEDHDDTRAVMGRLLRSFGFHVSSAGTVREALQLAQSERFDLLVSDIGLPDGSGAEVMRHLKTHQGIKGIALSGYGQPEDVHRSAEAGFETHLTKPVNFHTLQQVIKKVAG